MSLGAERGAVEAFENSLGAYLRKARAGHRALVMDGGEVVAELRRSDGATDRPNELIRQWLETCEIVPPSRPKLALTRPGVSSMLDGASGRILDQLRGADQEHGRGPAGPQQHNLEAGSLAAVGVRFSFEAQTRNADPPAPLPVGG